jgi:hypothetical protein
MKNVFFKAVLKSVMDLYAVEQAAVAKNLNALFTALVPVGMDIPTLVSNYTDAKPELQALLADPTADADLLAYAASLVGGQSPQVVAIISTSVDFVLTGSEKAYAVYQAIEAAKAAAAPAAAAKA